MGTATAGATAMAAAAAGRRSLASTAQELASQAPRSVLRASQGAAAGHHGLSCPLGPPQLPTTLLTPIHSVARAQGRQWKRRAPQRRKPAVSRPWRQGGGLSRSSSGPAGAGSGCLLEGSQRHVRVLRSPTTSGTRPRPGPGRPGPAAPPPPGRPPGSSRSP